MRYAVPQPYWSANEADASDLKRQLADAERTAAAATDWPTRTRAQQNAKQLRQRLAGIETDYRTVTARHSAAPAGKPSRSEQRFAVPVPYFASNDEPSFLELHERVQRHGFAALEGHGV